MTPTIRAPRDILHCSEAAWQRTVTDVADLFGWVWVHINDSRGEHVGVPDLLLWRGEEAVLAELKTEKGRVSVAQQQWHERAALAGVAVQVWRPRDWPEVTATLCAGYDVEVMA